MRWRVVVALLVLAPSPGSAQWTALDVPGRPEDEASLVEEGRRVYETQCWYCHGEDGDGAGPLSEYLWPRPRDFRIASFELRTTASGELPTDEDLYRTVTLGAPGTAMPAWGSVLSEAERWQVIAYLKTFGGGVFGNEAFDPYEVAIDVGAPPRASVDSLVEAGRTVYEESDCWECHGPAGRGDGRRMDQLTDDRGLPIRATDLERLWTFRGGSAPRDVYVRLSTGMDGTPMPSYAETMSEEARWQVAYYVASLGRDVRPDGAGPVVIPATRIEGALPDDPGDAAWDGARAVPVPLTGQATYPPRWQVPAVTDLAVRAMYNGDEVAIRIGWNDPVADSLPGNAERGTAEGWTADDTYPAVFPDGERRRGRYRDVLEVLYPTTDPTPPLPHFVYGDPGRTVDLWRWTARAGGGAPGDGVEELRAAGPGQEPRLLGASRQRATGRALWSEGRWRVVLRRPLTDDAPFRPGALVPVAFHVREGSHGETGLRMSLSSWYFLHLREEVGASEVLLVLLAVIGTVAGEYAVVRFVRRLAEEGRLREFGV